MKKHTEAIAAVKNKKDPTEALPEVDFLSSILVYVSDLLATDCCIGWNYYTTNLTVLIL